MSGINQDLPATKASWKQVPVNELPIIPSVQKEHQTSGFSGANSQSSKRQRVLTSNVFNFETQNLERIMKKKPNFQTRKASSKILEEESYQHTVNSPNSSLDPPSCAHLNFADVAQINTPNYHENKANVPYMESKKFNANRSKNKNSVRQHLSHSTYLSNKQLKLLYTNKFGNSQKISPTRDQSGQKRLSENPVLTHKRPQKLSVKETQENLQAFEDLRSSLYEKAQLQFDQSKANISDLDKKKQAQIKTAMNMLKRVEFQVAATSNRGSPVPQDQDGKALQSESPGLKIPVDSKFVKANQKDSLQASDKQDVIQNLLKQDNNTPTRNKAKITLGQAGHIANHSFTGNRSKGSASEYAPFNSQVTGRFSRFGVDSQIDFLNKQEAESISKKKELAKKEVHMSNTLKPFDMYTNTKIVPLKSHNFDVSPKISGRFCGGPSIKNSPPKFNNINLQRAPSHSPTSSANLSHIQTENLAVTTNKPSVSQLQSHVGFSPGIPLKNRSIVYPSESPKCKAFALLTQGQRIKEKEQFQFKNLHPHQVDKGSPAMDSFNSKADLMKDNSLDTIGLKELRSLDAKIENNQVTTENDISKIIEVGSLQIENVKAPGEAHIKILQQSSEIMMNEDGSNLSSIVQIMSKHESKEQVKAIPILNFDKIQGLSQNKYVRYKKTQDLQQQFDYGKGAVRIANGANSQREEVGLTGIEISQRDNSTQVMNDDIQMVSKHILSQPPDQASRTAVLQLNEAQGDHSRHSYGNSKAFHLMATPSFNDQEIQAPHGFGSQNYNQVSASTMMADQIHNSQGTLVDSQKFSTQPDQQVLQNKNVKIEALKHEGTTSSKQRNNDLDQSMFGDMIPPDKKVKDGRNKRGLGTVEKPQVYQNIINMNLMSELDSQPEKNTEEAAQAFATFAVDSARNNESARATSHLISTRGNKTKLNKKQLAIIGNNMSSTTSNAPKSKRDI